MRRAIPFVFLSLLACIGPSDQRPGLWLGGEEADFPRDWSFTDAHREIALEVGTPYGLRHSVTIWCASLDGALYVAARNPDEKRWPGWVASRPDVRLRVDGTLYEGRLVRIEDDDRIVRVRSRYEAKYDLPARPAEVGPPMRYWRVDRRS